MRGIKCERALDETYFPPCPSNTANTDTFVPLIFVSMKYLRRKGTEKKMISQYWCHISLLACVTPNCISGAIHTHKHSPVFHVFTLIAHCIRVHIESVFTCNVGFITNDTIVGTQTRTAEYQGANSSYWVLAQRYRFSGHLKLSRLTATNINHNRNSNVDWCPTRSIQQVLRKFWMRKWNFDATKRRHSHM